MLKIEKTEMDGHTGHITVHCRIVEKKGNSTMEGAPETHGTHPDHLHSKYGGNVKLWLDDLHRDMLARHEARKKAAAAMEQLKKIQFID